MRADPDAGDGARSRDAGDGVRRWLRGFRHVYGFAIGPSAVSIAASGVSAAVTLVIAREIGALQFGGYALVITVSTLLMIVMLLSLNFVMYQELPRSPASEHPAMISTALCSAVLLGLAVAALCLAAGPLLAALFGVDGPTLRHAVAVSLAMSASMLAESFLRGMRRFYRAAGLRLLSAGLFLVAAGVCLRVLGVRDFGVYTTLLAASHVLFSVLALAGLPVRPRLCSLARALRMYRHGAYVSCTSVLATVVFGVDIIVMNHFWPQDVVGAFSIYNGFPKRLLGILFTEGIGLVLLPTLATLDKPLLLRRIGRIAPLVGVAAAVPSFACGVVLLALLRDGYPYSLPLLALASVGIGVHTVFNLYFFALSMDGLRGARVVIACVAASIPPALAAQVLLIRWSGLTGGLLAFVVTNALLIAVVAVASARTYRAPQGARVPDRADAR